MQILLGRLQKISGMKGSGTWATCGKELLGMTIYNRKRTIKTVILIQRSAKTFARWGKRHARRLIAGSTTGVRRTYIC